MSRPVTRACQVLLTVLAAGISSCAAPLDPPTAPGGSSGTSSLASYIEPPRGAYAGLNEGLYPLQLGNFWSYRQRVVYTVLPNEGEPPSPVILEYPIDRQLVCLEHLNGRDYMVEDVLEYARVPDGPFETWIRYRQDRGGLYEADVELQVPPSCVLTFAPHERAAGPPVSLDALVPAGPPSRREAFRTAVERLQKRLALIDVTLGTPPGDPSKETGFAGAGELTRLRYPLYPGSRWVIRSDPSIRFLAHVEGTDVLDLPAGRLRGFRIRIDSDLMGPADEVRVWYGASGFLQLVAHLETDAVEGPDQIIGRAIIDERQVLDAMQLAGPPVTELPIGTVLLGD